MFFDDFSIGRNFSIQPVIIREEAMRSFAETYDPLPFHLDPEYAAKSAFGKLVAPGVMSFMAVWSEFVKMNVWEENLIAGRSTKIEWFAPVYAGDALEGGVTVLGAERTKMESGLVVLGMDIYNQHGMKVILQYDRTCYSRATSL
jgi:acyl dehydratase